jgi:hypothetical protein
MDHFLVIRASGFGIRHSVANASKLWHITILQPGGLAAAIGIDDPTYDANSQLTCETILAGFGPCSSVLEESVVRGPIDVVGAPSPGQQWCVITNVNATSFNGLAASCAGPQANACACTNKTTTAPTKLGTTGTQCASFCPDGDPACDGKGAGGADLGADVRCLYEAGAKTTRSAFGSDGQLTFCGATVPGVNDGLKTCANFAERVLNQKRDGSGCPLASVACP